VFVNAGELFSAITGAQFMEINMTKTANVERKGLLSKVSVSENSNDKKAVNLLELGTVSKVTFGNFGCTYETGSPPPHRKPLTC
jgi:hypothetical protein